MTLALPWLFAGWLPARRSGQAQSSILVLRVPKAASVAPTMGSSPPNMHRLGVCRTQRASCMWCLASRVGKRAMIVGVAVASVRDLVRASRASSEPICDCGSTASCQSYGYTCPEDAPRYIAWRPRHPTSNRLADLADDLVCVS
jgi:hypothetical protein